jgi:hypothetical protein
VVEVQGAENRCEHGDEISGVADRKEHTVKLLTQQYSGIKYCPALNNKDKRP